MLNKLNARLIDCWQQAWKLWSVQMHAVGTLIAGLLLMVPAMPDEVQALIPTPYRAAAIGIWFVGGLYFRLRKQGGGNG